MRDYPHPVENFSSVKKRSNQVMENPSPRCGEAGDFVGKLWGITGKRKANIRPFSSLLFPR